MTSTTTPRPRPATRGAGAAALRAAASRAVQAHVERHGLRRSATRDAVVEAFLELGAHASVEELTARLRARSAAVGQATVYRALKLLEACGVAAARDFGDGVTRWEPVLDRRHHDHLVCTGCGAVIEFENPEIERLQLEVARHHGFEAEAHRLELFGRCPACRGAAARRAGRP